MGFGVLDSKDGILGEAALSIMDGSYSADSHGLTTTRGSTD